MISKLSQANHLDLDSVRGTVRDGKFDSLSAQYNMLMDKYAQMRRGEYSC